MKSYNDTTLFKRIKREKKLGHDDSFHSAIAPSESFYVQRRQIFFNIFVLALAVAQFFGFSRCVVSLRQMLTKLGSSGSQGEFCIPLFSSLVEFYSQLLK